MQETTKSFLASDFFWGILVGLVLSLVIGLVLAKAGIWMQQSHQKRVIKNFCIDLVDSLREIIAEMDKTRDRAKGIHHDFLHLIDAEIAVYGRNREHLIHLPDAERKGVREFLNGIALKKAEVAGGLERFYQISRLADDIRAQGRSPEADRKALEAVPYLQEAQRAADKLVTVSSGATDLLIRLKNL